MNSHFTILIILRGLKVKFPQKWKLCHHLLTLMSIKTNGGSKWRQICEKVLHGHKKLSSHSQNFWVLLQNDCIFLRNLFFQPHIIYTTKVLWVNAKILGGMQKHWNIFFPPISFFPHHPVPSGAQYKPIRLSFFCITQKMRFWRKLGSKWHWVSLTFIVWKEN